MYPKVGEVWQVKEGMVNPGRKLVVKKIDPLDNWIYYAFVGEDTLRVNNLHAWRILYERVNALVDDRDLTDWREWDLFANSGYVRAR